MLFELFDILRRGARLRCPCCGYGRLFETAFRRYDRCSACGERFEREPGQWFGAVYINLGLTIAFTLGGIILVGLVTDYRLDQQLRLWLPLAASGPLLFHRPAQGMWTSLVFLGEGLYLPWPRR